MNETPSKWYMVTDGVMAGAIVPENLLMPVLDSDQLVYCIEGQDGRRVVLNVRPLSPMLAYRKLEQRLMHFRQTAVGGQYFSEDPILDLMDKVWEDLTVEERAVIDTEWHQASKKRNEDKPTDPQKAQP
jgi:hypothetical protein